MPNDTAPVSRPSFSKTNPRLQLAIDSTSISAMKTCPQYYKLNILDGYYRGGEDSVDLKFGILFHRATELYDHEITSGTDHDEAIKIALESVIASCFDSETKTLTFRETVDSSKNLYTLLRAIVWYLDKYQIDHLKTHVLSNGRPAVELSFQITLNDLTESGDASFLAYTGEEYILCGHLDKVVEYLDELRFKDTKTTRRNLDQKYFAQYNPHIQVTIYSIAMDVIFHEDIKIGGALIDAIQTLANGNRFRRQQISRTPGQLNEFLTDLIYLLREYETYAQDNYYPRRETACNMYSGCMYRDVCSHDPAARDLLLETFYSRREPWEPINPR